MSKNTFDVEKFQQEVFRLNIKAKVSEDEILKSVHSPELLLALIEHHSSRSGVAVLKLSKKVPRLEAKELRSLYKILRAVTTEKTITKFDLENKLLVDLYRLSHKPKGFWRSLRINQSLKNTFIQMNDQIISERIDIALANRSLQGAFNLIIVDPKIWGVFKETYDKRKGAIKASLAIAIWASTIGIAPEINSTEPIELLKGIFYMPAYVPSFKNFLETKITNSDLDSFSHLGWKKALEKLSSKLRKNSIRIRRPELIRKAYHASFISLFTLAITIESIPMMEKEFGAEAIKSQTNYIEKSYQKSLLSPRQLAIENFEKRLLEQEKKMGIVIPRDAVEVVAERERWIQRRVEAHKKTSQTTVDEASSGDKNKG